MKKLLTILIALLLLLSAEGQILRYNNYTAPAEPEEPSEPFDGGMISNGDFSSGADWSFGFYNGTGTGWSISGGQATCILDVNDVWYKLMQLGADMVTDVVVNGTYTIEFDVSSAAGHAYIAIGNYAGDIGYSSPTDYSLPGHLSIDISVPDYAETFGISIVFIQTESYYTTPVSIDNVELRVR